MTSANHTWYDSVEQGVVVEQYTHVELKVVGVVRNVGAQPLPEVQVEVLQYVSAATAASAFLAFARVRDVSGF